jgi:hypothetical protein
MRLMRYHFSAVYTPGKNLVIADTLSRSPLNEYVDMNLQDEIQLCVDKVFSTRVSLSKLSSIRLGTWEDPVLCHVMRYIKNAWPDYTQDVHESTLDYYSVRNMLSESDGVLTYGDRIVIHIGYTPRRSCGCD